MGGAAVGELEPIDVGGGQGLLHEEAVAVLGPAGPAADGPVGSLSRRPISRSWPDVDDLLEREEVGLERGHVAEDERQALTSDRPG